MANETAINETVNTTSNLVDSVDSLKAKLAVMREAQKKFATYTQEQVDKISLKLLWLQIWLVFHLQNRQLLRLEWES